MYGIYLYICFVVSFGLKMLGNEVVLVYRMF